MTRHTIEPTAQAIADATSKPPFLYELGPDGARKILDDIQAGAVRRSGCYLPVAPDLTAGWAER